MESVNTDNDDQMEITKMQNVQRITDIITMAKPSTSAKRAGAVANVKDIMANDKAMNLPEREVQALKTWNRINDYAKKSLPQLAEIGQVILDKRKSCTDDQSFAKAIEASPLAKIPYGQRKICMDLAEYWGKLKPLLGTEGYTSTSADLLVRKYKADNGIGTKRGAQAPKASKKSSDKKTPVKTEMTKAQVLAMLQASIKAGVIVKDDLKNIDWTVTK